MDFTDWLWLKLIILGVLAFFGNLFFTLITGRTIGEALRERRARRDNPGHR